MRLLGCNRGKKLKGLSHPSFVARPKAPAAILSSTDHESAYLLSGSNESYATANCKKQNFNLYLKLFRGSGQKSPFTLALAFCIV